MSSVTDVIDVRLQSMSFVFETGFYCALLVGLVFVMYVDHASLKPTDACASALVLGLKVCYYTLECVFIK